MLVTVRDNIISFIDFFHKPFAKWIKVQTFRYLACGGSNTVMDILLYFISYNFILMKQPVHVMGLTITPHIAAFIMSFSISFPTGFALAKYIVFQESTLRGRVQLFRYAVLVCTCIILNYVFLKLFVETFLWYPTPSKIVTTIIVAVYSYISQRNFTFKVKPVMAE
ncbi:MAG: GtrA family protein [Chitinophagales bacterium]|nr:GtrA family protein [Chitinophagaceae bacterium]MCB9063522.1 GtrA family protein [Chitinophagales bacterium]